MSATRKIYATRRAHDKTFNGKYLVPGGADLWSHILREAGRLQGQGLPGLSELKSEQFSESLKTEGKT